MQRMVSGGVIAVAMLKGGTRKSTTAMMLALGLARLGERVMVVDADAGTQGVTDWMTEVYARGILAATDEPPVDVVQWSPREGLLVPYVGHHIRRTGAERVIIDIGGEAPEVASQALTIADLALSPCGAERAETGRLEATRDLVRMHCRGRHEVLLTRVPVPRRGAARDARAALSDAGYVVSPVEIPHQRDLYAHCWGTLPEDIGEYRILAHLIHGAQL